MPFGRSSHRNINFEIRKGEGGNEYAAYRVPIILYKMYFLIFAKFAFPKIVLCLPTSHTMKSEVFIYGERSPIITKIWYASRKYKHFQLSGLVANNLSLHL